MIVSKLAVVTALMLPAVAYAQGAPAVEDQGPPSASAQLPDVEQEGSTVRTGGLEDIVVTARKRARAEQLQDVPLAMTAISGANLEQRQIQDLSQMTASIPNASLDEVGAAKGTAAFSIRGIAMGSTLPTLESPVGVFLDGFYMPSVLGVITDFFDVETVEVLRGPQGTLFGKNVTAGAVLVRTRRPSNQLEGYVDASVETGLEYSIGGAVSGPISDTVRVRLAGQWSRDEGWFTNKFDGKPYGRGTTWLVRPSVEWDITPSVNLVARFEHGRSSTRGLPIQNMAFQDRDTFDFSQDHAGGTFLEWDMLTGELTWDTGAGTITNVTGYRKTSILTDYDTAGTEIQDYQINYSNPTSGFSNEIRYANTFFDRVDLTLGLYYASSDIQLYETRRLRTLNFVPRTYGGVQQKASTYAAFGEASIRFSDRLSVTGGLRYTYDRKRANVGLFMGARDTCAQELSYQTDPRVEPPTFWCEFAFPNLRDSWKSLSPRLGVQFFLNDDVHVYASYNKGYRAGGFTSRQTAPNQALSWDQESTTAYELGVKGDFLNNRVRINLAGFINKVDDMIRVTTTPGVAGVVNDTRNTGDATIKGLEGEATIAITDNLVVNGHFGYQTGKYDTIRFSLVDAPGEPVGTINQTDYNLKLVRLAPWTYGVGFTHTMPLGEMALRTRVDYNYRDRAFTTDDNTAFQNKFVSLDASATLDISKRLSVGIYGRNLTNHAFQGLVVTLPASLLPPITSGRRPNVGWLSEGRVIGASLRTTF